MSGNAVQRRQQRRRAQKKRRREEVLHQRKLEAMHKAIRAADPIEPARVARREEEMLLTVYIREKMFPAADMYSAEQIAAADAVIAAFSPEERTAAIAQASRKAAEDKPAPALTRAAG